MIRAVAVADLGLSAVMFGALFSLGGLSPFSLLFFPVVFLAPTIALIPSIMGSIMLLRKRYAGIPGSLLGLSLNLIGVPMILPILSEYTVVAGFAAVVVMMVILVLKRNKVQWRG